MSKEHTTAADGKRISKLVNMENPLSVLDEVKRIVCIIFPEFDFEPVEHVFNEVAALFRGEYPGYWKCDTKYHDLKHSTDVLLAMARLVHGAILQGETYSQKNIALGLISALFHDTGYIRKQDDHSGTGAKYALVHIRRSIEFMDLHFANTAFRQQGFSGKDFGHCANMLRCTGFSTKINEIQFEAGEIEQFGKMLGAADLLGQMADRVYLERLLLLYYEFKEGHVGEYTSEFDLLEKTLGFYDTVKKRLSGELGSVNRYMISHFINRWNIDGDLYEDAIEKNRDYLKYILANHEEKYRAFLKRGGIVKALEEQSVH